MDRSRTAGLGDMKSFFDDAGDVFCVGDQVAVFNDGHGHADHIGFLKGVGTDEVVRNLAGDVDDGD